MGGSTKFVSLVFSLIVFTGAAGAQGLSTREALPEESATPATSIEAAKELESVITPPAPPVTKRIEGSISVPPEDSLSGPRYEERGVAASRIRIGSGFGYRRDPFTRRSRFHSGLDIKAGSGDPVGASHPGTIQFAGWYYGYGNLVIVDHGSGVTTYYAHLSSFEVAEGSRVDRGTILGRAGRTGRATSPHLHYEVRLDGEPVDPLSPIVLDPSSTYFDEAPSKEDEAERDSN